MISPQMHKWVLQRGKKLHRGNCVKLEQQILQLDFQETEPKKKKNTNKILYWKCFHVEYRLEVH